MVPIVRACADPRWKRVVGVVASQMGKTEAVFNVMGHRLDDDPVPILYIGPTQKLVESVSNDRVKKMFRSARGLWERLAKGKQDKITEKFIAGVRVGFGWAGSATELSSHPAGLVFVDERDRMEAVKGEGDPVELADARVSTFPDGRVIIVSTPTIGNAVPVRDDATGLERWATSDQLSSPIWQLWQEGTRYEWAWPCPECQEFFVPRFRQLTWPEGATPEEARRRARLVCPCCGALIPDEAKAAMNARGVYVAPGQRIARDGTISGPEPEGDVASFWVSGLCSPWRTFGQRARAYVTALAAGDPARIQAVVNTGFGELYALAGDAPAWQDVAGLKEGYAEREVPAGVQAITCGVDVQKNRLEFAVRGWGWNMESWLIEAGELWGETQHDAVWDQLAALLERDYGGRRIRLMLVDSGYNPTERDRNPDNQIYAFCRRHRRAFASKGHDKLDKPFLASKIDVSIRGKLFKNGLDLWHVDTDYFKSWVHARLAWPEDKPGGWRLHRDTTDDYCKQLVAEARTVNPTTNKVIWVRLRRENHKLDCEALNVAAAHILRLHGLPRPKAAEGEEESGGAAQGDAPVVQPDAPPAQIPAKEPQAAAQARRKFAPVRVNWATGWRR